MTAIEDHARSIFLAAVERAPDQWPAFLDEACRGDAKLRARVEQLLRAHEAMGSIHVGLGGAAPTAAIDMPLREGPGSVIGHYKLLEQLGEGGMGVVFLAEQSHPVRRQVALKVIKAGMDTRQVVARFQSERQALALMDHPNIAKVLDAGATDSGRPYFVMELVKGVPITRYCDEHRLTPRDRLALFVQVCQAVQHAHTKGIIHRDIKPSNVLIALYDGKPVPKVIDFGVAKATGGRLTEATVFTGFGAVVGTPEYMSPEQAELNQLDIDTRSDVYSLGVILYELLTGSTPLQRKHFNAAALLEVLRVVREQDPPKPSTRLSTTDQLASIAASRGLEPRKLGVVVRGELDWIVMKALEKDRDRRYQTANGFAADVQRFLADEPVQACPQSATYRFRKFARRNKAPMAAAATCVAGLVTALVALSVSNVLVGRERDRTRAALSNEQRALGQAQTSATEAATHLVQARQSERSMRQALYAARIMFAQQAGQDADVQRMVELLNGLRPDPGQEDLRGFEWYHLWQVCHSQRMTLQETADVYAVAYSPDGMTLASAAGANVTMWNAATGEKLARFTPASGLIRCIAFSPDGSLLAIGGGTASQPGEASLWEVATRQKKMALANLPEPVMTLAFSADGKRLALGMANVVATGLSHEVSLGLSVAPTTRPNRIRVLETASGKETGQFNEPTGSILSVAFSPDGASLVTGGHDKRVIIWDTATAAQRTSEEYVGPVSAVAISPDGSMLAVGYGTWEQATSIMLYQFPSMKLLRTLRGHKAGITSLAFSPDGQKLVSGSYDRTVIVWKPTTGWRINHRLGPHAFVMSVAFSPDGASVASGGRESELFVWDIATGSNDLLPVHPGGLALAFLADGRVIISGRPVTLFDRKTATTRPIEAMQGGDIFVAGSPDGNWFAAVDQAGDLKIWDARTLTRRHHFKGPGRDEGMKLWGVSFSPDGKLVATGGNDDIVTIRETESGQLINQLRPKGHRVKCISFSPDGTLATATMETESRTQIWNPRTGECIATFDRGALSIAYSPDGRLLATGGQTQIAIYDTRTFKLVRRLTGHNQDIWGMAFSPDGRTLATGGYDKTLRLWSVSNGEILLTYPMEAIVWAVAFSPDGRTLAANTWGTHFFDAADVKSADEGMDAIHHRWRTLLTAGKGDEAEQLLRKNIEQYTGRYGADDHKSAHLTAELASLLVRRREPSRYAEAERLLIGARQALSRTLPNGHSWRYSALLTAQELYGPEAMNDPVKLSQTETVASVTTVPTIPEPGKWIVKDLDAINAEAWKLRRDGKLQEAAALRQQVVTEAKRLLPSSDMRLFKYLTGYAELLTLLQRNDEAKANYLQAQAILAQQPNPTTQDNASLTAGLSNLDKASGPSATTARAVPVAATELLAWDRQSPQDVSRAVQSALVADLASPSLLPFDRLVYGEHLILGGEAPRAVAAIRQALDEANQTGAVPRYYYKSLGWALLACGESEQATATLSKTFADESRWKAASPPADADPDEWTAAYLLSRVTQEQYTSRFSPSPNASFPWFYVGQLMEIQGKRDAAVLAYQKAIGLGTHHTRHWAAYRLQGLGQQPPSPTSRSASPAK